MSAEMTAWLFDSIVLFIQVTVVLVWLYGLLLVLFPVTALSLQQRLNIRFSGRKLSRPLEIPLNVDRYIYRHARPVGLVLTLGAIGLLYLNWQLPSHVQPTSPSLWAWLAESLYWFLWISGITTIFIGLACIFRPSLLKSIENRANHWVSTRQKAEKLSQEYTPLDGWLQQNPRLAGLIISSVSSFLMLIILRV